VVEPTLSLPGFQSTTAPPREGTLTACHLPRRQPYLPVWARQRELAAARAAGRVGDLLLLLEHEHVYTLGRRGDEAHLLADAATLARWGVACHRVDRGGDITYHGPGQLVGYPIVRLRGAGRGVRAYVEALETALIAVAAAFGIAAATRPGRPGVWVGDQKLAALGITVSHGIAYHGFALNVAPDLAYFARIVPCGIADAGVTSLAALLGRRVTVEEVVPVCARAVADACGLQLRWVAPDDPARSPGQCRAHRVAGR
jgi:lipoyl(octanoyl) transferase